MATIVAQPSSPQERPGTADGEWLDVARIGPGALAGRYLRGFWQPVALASEIPVGRALPIEMVGEHFTLYRGQGGEVHAIDFRCAHRGTQLSTGWVEGDNLRCFYHGWVYGPDGQCVEQPAEPEPFCQRIHIGRYPVREYLGLIFAFLGEGEPPEFTRFPEMEGEGIVENSSYVRMCNYFNQLESNMDEVHVSFVHRASDFTDTGLNNDIPTITGEETEYGIVKYGHRRDQPVRVSHFFWPNSLLIALSAGPAGISQNLAWRVPIDDARHRSFNASFLPITGEAVERHRERQAARLKSLEGLPTSQEVTDAVLCGELHVDDLRARPDAVNVQDNVAQAGQGIIVDRSIEHLGRSDHMVAYFRRIWQRELRALQEGRPLKQWRKTGVTLATYGAD